MSKKQRHHVYPKRFRSKGTREIKFVQEKEHRLWHQLVSDRSPEDAIRYIADTFLPSEFIVRVEKIS